MLGSDGMLETYKVGAGRYDGIVRFVVELLLLRLEPERFLYGSTTGVLSKAKPNLLYPFRLSVQHAARGATLFPAQCLVG